MLLDMLYRHLVTVFLIVLFSTILWKEKSSRDTELRYFWLTVLSCLVLVLEDTFESIASQDPSLRFWRTLMSMIGYSFRSCMAVGLLLVVAPREKRRWILWVPCIITLLVNATAFFSDVAFGFDDNYDFYRGPLGIVSFIVPLFYIILLLWFAFRRFTERRSLRIYIVVGCAIFCLASATVDAVHGGIRLNEAVMSSCILFYIALRAHNNRHDLLTGLLNREALYDDSVSFNSEIGAVASLDMNGLKQINDTRGHHAGDEALIAIAGCMKKYWGRDALIYRIGGDEFMILFFHAKEEAVTGLTDRIREDVSKAGYSISVGYAMREGNEDLEKTFLESDRRMYADKANYYRVNGRDRRRRREDDRGSDQAR